MKVLVLLCLAGLSLLGWAATGFGRPCCSRGGACEGPQVPKPAPSAPGAPTAVLEALEAEPAMIAGEDTATRASVETPALAPPEASLEGSRDTSDLALTDFTDPQVLERKRAFAEGAQQKLLAQKLAQQKQQRMIEEKLATAQKNGSADAALLAKWKKKAALSAAASPLVKLPQKQ
ncbi:MAG: hypothetical protein IPJ19_13530 [Planctomycetes bacterium]|nr:hypothetical protein [Planctomycetota bacterium]